MSIRASILVAALSLAAACPGGTPKKSETTVTQEGNTRSSLKQVLADKTTTAFENYCREGLENAKQLLPRVLTQGGDQGPRTIENTLEPYNDMMRNIEQSAALASLMRSVHPKEEIRDIAAKCEQDVEAFTSELGRNKLLFKAFAELDTSSFDADTKRLVEHTLRDFRRSGVDKDDATRERLKQIDDQLVVLGQEFGKNIVDDVRSISVDSASMLAGLPDDYISGHPAGADGKIKITTDYPDYIPFLNYADNDDLRKQLYIASRSRGGEKNEGVLKKILTLRFEKAKLLGYPSWADYITEDKMIKTSRAAADFIQKIVGVAEKRAQSDYQELLDELRKTSKGAKVVQDWQKSYLENHVKKASYAFDPQQVRPYFEFTQVQQGLLAITSEIYDIQYRPTDEAPLWHEDVKAFDVFRGDDRIGRIFLDMHPRDGKYKHAAQFTLMSGVKGKQLPEGVLVCNFPNPRTTDGPALMEHDDVVTMFHEFGHLMHHILGGQKRWIDQSGVATEWDFVEAPSQMFEEWAWSYETLKRFAKQYKTGEVIPEELVARMRRANKFGIGIRAVQQMFYASISLHFHDRDPAALNMLDMVKELQVKYTPFPYVDGTRFHANFGHLNGYSAIYYTYMWSEVIAKDLLTPFKQHGLMNKEWTYRYRDRILAAGGSKDAADLIADFLGRPYNFDAFQAYLSE